MKNTPPHHFHVRLPEDLFADIADDMRRKGGKSLNREIVSRLRETTKKDAADRIAAALRPLLESLDEAERDQFALLTIQAVELLARRKKRGRKANNNL